MIDLGRLMSAHLRGAQGKDNLLRAGTFKTLQGEQPGGVGMFNVGGPEYRGEIDGGIGVRRVEDFVVGTERRHFVIKGRPYTADPSEPIPVAVRTCAERIPSTFFSVDVVQRSDGASRIVEVGDGQVSDLVGWLAERFAGLWQEAR